MAHIYIDGYMYFKRCCECGRADMILCRFRIVSEFINEVAFHKAWILVSKVCMYSSWYLWCTCNGEHNFHDLLLVPIFLNCLDQFIECSGSIYSCIFDVLLIFYSWDFINQNPCLYFTLTYDHAHEVVWPPIFLFFTLWATKSDLDQNAIWQNLHEKSAYSYNF